MVRYRSSDAQTENISLASGYDQVKCVTTRMCWLCYMLHESERLKRVSKANGVSIVAQVEVDVEVSADNYWTAAVHELLEHRRLQFVETRGRQRGTSRPVDAEQHQLTHSIECRWIVIENPLH